MDKSLVSLRRKFIVLGLFATATVLFLAPRASANTFVSTFNLGSMNVSDFSVPPSFFTGPFNYGFTALALDPAATGQVTINRISVYGSSPSGATILSPKYFRQTPEVPLSLPERHPGSSRTGCMHKSSCGPRVVTALTSISATLQLR